VWAVCRALRAPGYFYFFKLSNFTRLFLPDHFTHMLLFSFYDFEICPIVLLISI